ncbi:M48 family metallopeptidase [Oxalobacter paraformigenes]|uniref:PDZ domain-containing protein n=1 Tax=Oxalobacter paraformigenes TaxID=556268 RepID=C3X6T1_9BURK|nr:M48 family metallopeptidase [Oxalobacter paraformigenes]EEO28917.1 hypothetical protein OFAG_02070 [Oxalobacter paraformigenes]
MIKRLQSLKRSIRNYRILPRLVCLCCAALVSACATDTAWVDNEEAVIETAGPAKLKQIVAMQDRLDKVGGKLLIDNADLCRKQFRNLLGFSVANKYTYSTDMASLAAQTYGLDDRLQIMNVIPGSGAQRAGLQRGDILLRIENRPVPQGIHAERDTVAMLSPMISKNKSLNLTVLRNNARKNVSVPLTPACGFRIELGQTGNVNTYSDGSRILVTQGMMLFAKSDENLAYVISKEMAHNVLGHAKTLQNTRAATTLIDNLLHTPPRSIAGTTGLKPMPKKFDIDADTLSLAMALRGGYEIDDATRFWKRLAYRFPATNARNYTALHPATSARLEAMPQSITRIKAIDKRRKALAKPK